MIASCVDLFLSLSPFRFGGRVQDLWGSGAQDSEVASIHRKIGDPLNSVPEGG